MRDSRGGKSTSLAGLTTSGAGLSQPSDAAASGAASDSKRTLPQQPTDDAAASKGSVALGPGAGAFGPWRAHHVIDGIAQRIADQIPPLLAGTDDPRVLVVDDPALLQDDWTAHYVMASLAGMAERLKKLSNDAGDAWQQLNTAIDAYRKDEASQALGPVP
jgi:hypothetical protein